MSRRLPDPWRDRRLCPEKQLEAARHVCNEKAHGLIAPGAPPLYNPIHEQSDGAFRSCSLHLQPAEQVAKVVLPDLQVPHPYRRRNPAGGIRHSPHLWALGARPARSRPGQFPIHRRNRVPGRQAIGDPLHPNLGRRTANTLGGVTILAGFGHVSARCSPIPPGSAVALSVRLRLISLPKRLLLL